jgi:dihydroflavonol-4-reductase
LNSFSMTIQEAVGLLASVIDRPLRVNYLPASVALVGGTVIGAVYRLIGQQAPVCREMVRTLVHGHVYDGSRAARELGLSYTPATDTLTRLISWARAESLIP